MVKVGIAVVVLCSALACSDEEHYPPGGGPGPTGSGGGGNDDEGDDDPVSEVAVADACRSFADDRCAGALACDLDSLVGDAAGFAACLGAMALYCVDRRTAPVSSDDLAACTDAIAAEECTAELPVPEECGALWDTEPPDRDGGLPDASVDAGIPDAAPPDAGP